MRRMIGRVGRGLAFAGTAVSMGWIGMTLGTASAREPVLLPFPAGESPVAREREQDRVDSARVRRLLQAARGANSVMCELAAMTVDGRSGWSSGMDGAFHAGGSSDSLARDVSSWVHHDEVDPTAIPLLGAALGDPDWCVRRLAAPVLGRSHDASALRAMLAALAASDAGAREMGALALGFGEDPRSIPPLIARLRDDTPRVRATAAWALGEIESKEAIRPLIEALADADALVRESAAHALGEIEDAAAVPALTDLLKSDREPAVRRAAARALGEIVG